MLGDNDDCIDISSPSEPAFNVIVDHCSLSWAGDELASAWNGSYNVTVSWCILSEGLKRGILPKDVGYFGFGLLVGPNGRRVSVHHNLFAHNRDRNPKFGGTSVDSPFPASTDSEAVNNVIYNWHWHGTWMRGNPNCPYDRPQQINVIGNYYKPGPNTLPAAKGIECQDKSVLPTSKLYVYDNLGPGRWNSADAQWAAVLGEQTHQASSPVGTRSGVTAQPVLQALEAVLQEAGAAAPYRDAVDKRVVDQFKKGTGKQIGNPADVGGWPTLVGDLPAKDTDGDGMPDTWEAARGLNPQSPKDASTDRDADGYTYIEEYLNQLFSSATTALRPPGDFRVTIPTQ
jgi:hypothetical protein